LGHPSAHGRYHPERRERGANFFTASSTLARGGNGLPGSGADSESIRCPELFYRTRDDLGVPRSFPANLTRTSHGARRSGAAEAGSQSDALLTDDDRQAPRWSKTGGRNRPGAPLESEAGDSR